MGTIKVTISNKESIEGKNPIVLLGPNGSGKTRRAAEMVGWNNADMISALRNLEIRPELNLQPFSQADQQLRDEVNQMRSRPWRLSNEIDHLFSKLMVEDSAVAIRYWDAHQKGVEHELEETKLTRLRRVWQDLFPGREINFEHYQPSVRASHLSGEQEYAAQQMSDGERVALYLGGRVLDCESHVLIVDEPEVHFHSRLAIRFWNAMESLRPDCRFVYVTHDLPFALSRRDATYVVMSPKTGATVANLREGLPSELSESLLAAASFSVYAERIIFCEGKEGKSIDKQLLEAWFNSPEEVVVPVGSNKDVVRCTEVFSETNLVTNMDAIGVIDRDYWPERYLDRLPDKVQVLDVHEIENLFCLREVFVAVATHHGKSQDEADTEYKNFLDKAKRRFNEELLAKQMSERFKRRVEHAFGQQLSRLEVLKKTDELRDNHVSGTDPNSWTENPARIFDEERETVESGISGAEEEFHRIVPGKSIIDIAAN